MTLTNEQLIDLTNIVCTVDNTRITGFAAILVTETNYSDGIIIEFFHYWSNMDDHGTWLDAMTYSFDHPENNVMEGLLFNDDNIMDTMDEFVSHTVPTLLEKARDMEREYDEMKADLGVRV